MKTEYQPKHLQKAVSDLQKRYQYIRQLYKIRDQKQHKPSLWERLVGLFG